MAKAQTVPVSNEVDYLDSLLTLDAASIKMQTPAGGGRGKREIWAGLSNDEIKLLHLKVLANNKIAAEVKVGARDAARFFVISPIKTNEKTPEIARGQRVSFVKDNQLVVDVVVGFTQTGTGKKLTYTDGETEVTFPISGMSVITKSGAKAIAKCNLNPQDGDTITAEMTEDNED